MMKQIQKEEKEAGRVVGMGVLMGFFSAGRGIGAVVSGPVSEALLRRGKGRAVGGLVAGGFEMAFGGMYGGVVVFTGVSAAVGGLVCLGLKRRK